MLYLMPITDKAFLHNLLMTPGPSAFESSVASVWRTQAEQFAQTISTDVYGNTFAHFNVGKKPRIMLSGHIDEIGLIITYIGKDGFLYFKGIGGWDAQQLIGQRVRIQGYKGSIIGVIGKKAIHLMAAEERRKPAKTQDMWIDIGAKDALEAKRYVRPGDSATIEQPYVELLNNRFVSKAIDNRIGAYVVLEAAKQAADSQVEVIAAATIQEEIGHLGAQTAAYALEPDIAIAVDVTHATDIPDIEKKHLGDIPLSSGASLSIGSVAHRGVFEQLISIAEAQNIPYTIEASPHRTYTDADDIAKSRYGVPTAVVSIPTRYMHSPNELIDFDDVEHVIALIVAFIKGLKQDAKFAQPPLP